MIGYFYLKHNSSVDKSIYPSMKLPLNYIHYVLDERLDKSTLANKCRKVALHPFRVYRIKQVSHEVMKI